MITGITIEACTVDNAAAKVKEIEKVFGTLIPVDVKILACAPVQTVNVRADGLAEQLSEELKKISVQEETIMADKTGAIEFNFITDMTKLPQRVASAASAVETAGLVGASYKPIVFCGTQLVRGTNYLFIAEQTLVTATPTKRVVSLKVNEFQGKFEIVKDSIKVIFG